MVLRRVSKPDAQPEENCSRREKERWCPCCSEACFQLSLVLFLVSSLLLPDRM